MPSAESTPPTGSRTFPLMPPLPGGDTPAAALPDLAIPIADAVAGAGSALEPSPPPVPTTPYPPGASMPPYPSTPYPPTPPAYTPPPAYAPLPPGYAPPPPGYAQPPYPYAPPPYPLYVPNSRRRAGYIIAAVGSVLALLAFFAFPFITISASLASSLQGTPSSFSYSQSLTASQLAGSSQSFSLASAIGLSAGTSSVLWITALAALAALVLCIAVPFSTAAIRNSPHHVAGWALIAGGLVSAALTATIGLMTLDQLNQTLRSITSGLGSGPTPAPIDFSISAGLGVGFYVLIASLLLMAAGGIVVLARRDLLARPPVSSAAPPTQPTAYS